MLKDEPEVVDIIVKSIQSLRAEEQTVRDETPEAKLHQEVLQTKIVSGREMRGGRELRKEMDSLMLEKKALTRLSPEEAKRLVNSDRKVHVLPGKAVYTLKPGLEARKKCRLVVCGNYGDSHDQQGGSDSVAMRLAVKTAAVREWGAKTLDVKCAFLNAPLAAADEEGEVVIVMKPPQLLVRSEHSMDLDNCQGCGPTTGTTVAMEVG